MKQKFTRVLVFCLSLGLCLTALLLTAFGTRITFEAPFTTVTCFDIRSRRVDVALSEEEQTQLLGYLNKKQWHEGADTCIPDYEFHNGDTTLTYHSICGQVVDCESNRSCSLSRQERTALNAWLKEIDTVFNLDETDDSVTIYHYPVFSGGMQWKTVYGPLATELKAHLAAAKETGEIEEAPDDDTAVLPPDNNAAEHHLRRTYWILANDTLYRCRENLSLVESYAGEGKILEKTEEFTDLLSDLWSRYPIDYYEGTYTRATDKLEIERTFRGDPGLHFHIKSLTIGEEKGDTNTLVLEVYSDEALSTKIDLWYWNNGCVIADTKYIDLELNGTEPATVQIHFTEDPLFGNLIRLIIGKTQTIIHVHK